MKRKQAPATADAKKPFKIPRTDAFRGTRSVDQPEFKYWDVTNTTLIDSTPEIMQQLNLIPQDDTGSGREGRNITIHSIQIEGVQAYTPDASSEGSCYVNMALVLDTQANGAVATVADVFTGGDMMKGLPQVYNSQRFRIIKRWGYSMNSGAYDGTVYSQVYRRVKYFRRLNIPLQFSGATGAISELRTNNLFIMAGIDGNDDDKVGNNLTCRIRYTDY